MRAIFLCERSDQIFKVYDLQTLCALQEQMEIEKRIYQKAEILADPAAAEERAKAIFRNASIANDLDIIEL